MGRTKHLIHRNVLGCVLGKLSLGKPSLKREDNKKLHYREIGCERGRCKEMSQNHVQYRASPLLALCLRCLLREVMAVSFIFLLFVLISIIDLADIQ